MKVNKIQGIEWTDYCGITVELPLKEGHAVAVQINDKKDTLLTIVHEAVHVWQKMMEYMGEDTPGIETEAYTIERICKDFILQYQKLTGDSLAVHEKRKERLRARSQGVHLPTGSSQETGGAEQSP